MKKCLILMLSVVTIMLSLSACSENSKKQIETAVNNSSTENSIPQTVEYEFYVDYSYGGEIPESTKDFKSWNELNVGLGYERIVLNDVPKTKKFEIDGEEITLDYKKTIVSDSENLNFDSYNRGYDDYRGKHNEEFIGVMLRKDTGDICFFLTGNSNDSLIEPLLSDDEYKTIATDELNSVLPSGWDKVYTECEVKNNESNNSIRVTFTRKDLFGCMTWEFLHVRMDYDGRVRCIDTRMYGLFDEIAETVTQEKVDAASNAIRARLIPDDSKNTLGNTMLYLDNEGNLYLNAGYKEIKSDGSEASANVYVNVN